MSNLPSLILNHGNLILIRVIFHDLKDNNIVDIALLNVYLRPYTKRVMNERLQADCP